MKPLLSFPIAILLGILIQISISTGFAQGVPNLGQTDRWMRGALSAMERKDYKTANELFRSLIESGMPLPDEMPYYFAETLFELGQYDNSKRFLDKYLEITGFNGQNYQGANQLKNKLSQPLSAIAACRLCDSRGYRYDTCPTCEGKKNTEQTCTYCKGKMVVGCSRCVASGLIKRVNVFNQVEFFECERCSGKGRLTCPECQGSGKQVSACKTCEGRGSVTGDQICNHTEDHEHQH